MIRSVRSRGESPRRLACRLAGPLALSALAGAVHSQVGTPPPAPRYFHDTLWRPWPGTPAASGPPLAQPAAPTPEVIQVQAVQRAGPDRPPASPAPDAVFRLESEAHLRARMAEE